MGATNFDQVLPQRTTGTASSGAVTANGQSVVITSEALTTASGSDYTLTLTNSYISASSAVLVSAGRGTSTQGLLTVVKITPTAGSVVVVIRNTHASEALNGTIIVNVLAI